MESLDSYIFIRDLRLYAYHGVMAQERRVGGWYTLSLRVHYNIICAMESDEVSDTVNYAELFEMVKAEMSIPSNLLEHVAGRIAKAVFNAYRDVTAIDLTIVKDNPPMGAHCRGAGVELHLINDKTK
ncbi:MAG: dihydroneopterin aldolase [Prevotella sp.]|nr:dihydroneopterin aldolase [Prevotella sp.]